MTTCIVIRKMYTYIHTKYIYSCLLIKTRCISAKSPSHSGVVKLYNHQWDTWYCLSWTILSMSGFVSEPSVARLSAHQWVRYGIYSLMKNNCNLLRLGGPHTFRPGPHPALGPPVGQPCLREIKSSLQLIMCWPISGTPQSALAIFNYL